MMAIGIVSLLAVILFLVYATYAKQEGAEGMDVNKPGGAATYTCLGNVNNPGNLISVDSVHWQGETTQPGQKFESFETLRFGVRAWYINLFGKMKKGVITNTTQMIDVLTPAGKENPEPARNNYKASVAKAKSWLELGKAVFDFEACPSWVSADSQTKLSALQGGFSDAVRYSYNGSTPQYFIS